MTSMYNDRNGLRVRVLRTALLAAGLTAAGYAAAAGVDLSAIDWHSLAKGTAGTEAAGMGYPIVAGGGNPPTLAFNIYSDGTNMEVDGSITINSTIGSYRMQSPFAGVGTVLKYGDAGLLANSDNLALTNPAANGDLLFLTSPGGGGLNERLRMAIDGATGNVGIGTATPSSTLDVLGAITEQGGSITHTNASGEARVTITNTGIGSDAGFIRADGPNSTNVLITNVSGFPDYGSISVYDGSTSRAFMSVDSNGDGNISSEYAHLVPQSSPPPGAASNGSMYYDSSNALCARVSGAWVRIAGSGTCS
jgi:hypothetical protein